MKYILVGCGHISQKHVHEIHRTGELIALCDPSIERMKSIRSISEFEMYTSFDEMMSHSPKANSIIICTPNAMHASQSIAALNQGYHVLCEKPMAIHSTDAKKMIDAADRNNRQLSIVKQIRHNTVIRALKAWIDSGKSGKVFSILLNCAWNRNHEYYASSAWRGKKDQDGGILYTQFSHFIDLLIWLLGDVVNVHSCFNNVHHMNSSQFEDQGSAILQFMNDALVTLHFSVNSFDKNIETSLLIIAENGNIKIGGKYCDIVEFANTKRNDFEMQAANSVEGHAAVYDQFIENIKTNHFDRKSLYEASKTVELIERMYGQ